MTLHKTNYLFLIGGYDLEMLEIVRLLEENEQQYVDKKLGWSTKLSDYVGFWGQGGGGPPSH